MSARNLVPGCLILSVLMALPVHARPEILRDGISYYSDEYFQKGLVRDIEGEKNYEEIYQFYTYYEAIYDSLGRVTAFKEYKRGELIYEEQYLYKESEPTPIKRTVLAYEEKGSGG